MQTKLGLFILVLFAFSINGFAQTNGSTGSFVRTSYETWRTNQRSIAAADQTFFAAEAERINSTTASLALGIATSGQGFAVSVKPLIVAKDASGKLVQTELAIAATLRSGGSEIDGFVTPKITFEVPAEANAVEISLQRDNNSAPIKITMTLKVKHKLRSLPDSRIQEPKKPSERITRLTAF